MGEVFYYLELRAQGRTREQRFLKSCKAVQCLLEDAAAKPTCNQPCKFREVTRATFLMDFSPNKLRIASTHGDHSVRVSNAVTGKCTHILRGHPRTPWCLAFSPTSDDILASGCLNGEIRIWDLMGGGSEVLQNPCAGQVITSLAFHPCGDVLAFATMNYIYYWDWSKGPPFAYTKTSLESERVRWLKFDPFGDYLYTGIGNHVGLFRDAVTGEMIARVITANGNSPPLTYKRFQSILSTLEPPRQPCETLTGQMLASVTTPITDDHDDRFSVPSLDELGFDTDTLGPVQFRGGESEALARLYRHLERKAWVASFERPKMSPQSLYPSGTGLSPYLRFGCLSPRTFYWKLTELYKKVQKGADPPLALHGQLLWREFFYTVATNNPNFDCMVGNSICVQIPWEHNPEALAKWAEGMTGFPWIDAIMVQLRKEGWIHHLARHAVACFLTRGDLWISWEEGMKVFDEMLLDADWSVNAGMWMWLSCSAFFQQFFHCYCPVGFGKRADPSGDFVRHYLPVLKGFPTQYIYEPWTAPESVQKAAKCIIGKDYPLPMVQHAEACRVNLERMRQVYKRLVLKSTASKRIFLDLPKIPKVSMFLSKAKMFLSSSSDEEVHQKQRRRKPVDE